MTQYDLNLRDYWRILRKRRFIVISSAVLLAAFSFLFAAFQHPTPLYRSSVSVKIEENKTLIGIYLQALAFSSADALETQTVIIKSYPVLEQVAKRLGLIKTSLTAEKIRANNQLLSKVLDLKGKIVTEREGNTNIINIYATDESPGRAQLIAATVAQVYKDENTNERNKRVFEARRFIEEQLRIVKNKLKESEEKVRQYRESHRVISLDTEAASLTTNLSKAESEYIRVKRLRENLQQMMDQLELEPTASTYTLNNLLGEDLGPAFSALQTRLLNFHLKRDTLLLDYTEKHPEVIKVTEQIDEVLNSFLQEIAAKQRALAIKEDQHLNELKEMRRKYSNLPQEGLSLARLERELKLNEDIVSQLESKYQEVLIKEAEKIEEVMIVRPALRPTDPINPPRTIATTAIGLLLGLILGAVFALIKESLDTSIGTIADVEDHLGLPVLGIITHIDPESIIENIPEHIKNSADIEDDILLGLASLLVPDSTMAENFRGLEANVQYVCSEKDAKVLLITASVDEEGKTTVAINLAATFAEMNYKTLLIDGDLRKPDLHRIFGLNREPGVSDIILGTNHWKTVCNTVIDMVLGRIGMEGVMASHGIDNLHIITAGTTYSNPPRLLASDQMKTMIAEMKKEYEIIIIDSPPILQSSDPIILGELVDGVLLIYKVGAIARGLLKRAKDQLVNVRANTLGVILNQLRAEVSPDFDDQSRYYKNYYFDKPEKDKKKKEKSNRGVKIILLIIASAALITGLYLNR